MSKMIKSKKDKVPKLTEEEYAQYISSLKSTDTSFQTPREEENCASNDMEERKEC